MATITLILLERGADGRFGSSKFGAGSAGYPPFLLAQLVVLVSSSSYLISLQNHVGQNTLTATLTLMPVIKATSILLLRINSVILSFHHRPPHQTV